MVTLSLASSRSFWLANCSLKAVGGEPTITLLGTPRHLASWVAPGMVPLSPLDLAPVHPAGRSESVSRAFLAWATLAELAPGGRAERPRALRAIRAARPTAGPRGVVPARR